MTRSHVSVRRRTKSDDPVGTGNIRLNDTTPNPWKYYREISCGHRKRGNGPALATWRSPSEEGEKRKSGWTLFYATPVLSSDQKNAREKYELEWNIVFEKPWNNDTWIQLIFTLWKLTLLGEKQSWGWFRFVQWIHRFVAATDGIVTL